MKLLREYIRGLLVEIAIGQCYPHTVKMAQQVTGEEFSDLSKFKVAHGRITDKFSGESVLHAWVEKGNMVFDWQTHSTKPDGIDREMYYDIFQPEIHNEYTAEETMVNCLKSGQAGPWTMQESVLLEIADQQLMVPAKILGSDSGEYRTEPHWQNFRKLPKEEQMAWAEEHFDGGIRKPLRVRVYADGALMFSDGHHRAKAAMLLDEMIPIVISRNQLQEKSDELWEYWLDLVLQGLHPKYDLNPEGYNIRTLEDAKELTGR